MYAAGNRSRAKFKAIPRPTPFNPTPTIIAALPVDYPLIIGFLPQARPVDYSLSEPRPPAPKFYPPQAAVANSNSNY